MATIIVRHNPSGRKYIMVGGDWFPNVEHGKIPLAAVCDARGAIQWLHTEELTVLEIDGRPIESFRSLLEPLAAQPREDAEDAVSIEACPACGTQVRSDDRECPSCGLTLILEES